MLFAEVKNFRENLSFLFWKSFDDFTFVEGFSQSLSFSWLTLDKKLIY